MNQEKIGKFIKEIRKEKDMTQQELADKLGVTDKAISKWENGKCLMDLSLIKSLCQVLDISVLELLNGERIKADDINVISNETLEKTLLYTKKEIKRNKKKTVILMLIFFIVLLISGYFIYQSYNLMRYSTDTRLNDYLQEIKGNLKPKDYITIYKKTIPEEDYLYIKNIKFKNYFYDTDFKCLPDIEGIDVDNYHCSFYEKNNDMKNYGVSIIRQYNDVEVFKNETEQDLYKEDYVFDGNEFILLNDINNDIDFINYINDNGYKFNNIFTSTKEMKFNFAYNNYITSFSRNFIDNEYFIINGDYLGYYYEEEIKGATQRCAVIIKDKYNYLIISRNEKFTKDIILEIISTLEIR